VSGWFESATLLPPNRSRRGVASRTPVQSPGVTLAPLPRLSHTPPSQDSIGIGSIPRMFFLTVDGVGVARNAPSRAATAESSPDRETSVVDDDDELSRRRRQEERRARPRRSAGPGVEPLNIVSSDRVSSDRTTSATASRHSRPWPSRAPHEPEGARLELPPAGSRADS